MNFFLFFFWFLSTLCVCRLSIKFDLLPPPSIESQCIFKRKKKVNKRTIRSVCHFSQAFIWMVRKSVMAIQMSCFFFGFFTYSTHSPSTYMQGATNLFYCCCTPCNSNFGDFFHIFISVDYMFFFWWKVCIGVMKLL